MNELKSFDVSSVYQCKIWAKVKRLQFLLLLFFLCVLPPILVPAQTEAPSGTVPQRETMHAPSPSTTLPEQAEHPPRSLLKKRAQTKGPLHRALKNSHHTKRLKKGKTIYSIVMINNQPQIMAEFLIKAPPQKAWNIITDIERYKEFEKGCTESRIIRKKDNMLAVKFSYNYFGSIKYDLTVIYTLDPENLSLQWYLREGPFHNFVGSWKLEPWGEETRASYTSYYRPQSLITDFIPEDVWLNMLKKHEIPHYIRTFKKRIKTYLPEKGKANPE